MPKKKANHKNYKHEGGFVGLPQRVFTHDAYKQLSCNARCLLDEFQSIYRLGRNGYLCVPLDKAIDRLGITDTPARNAFNQLMELGFIELMEHARYQQGKAREFCLTYEPCFGKEPTDEWRKIYEQKKCLASLKNKS